MMLDTKSVAACLNHALIGENDNTPDDIFQ